MKYAHLPLFAAAFDSPLPEQETIAAIKHAVHNRAHIFRPKNFAETENSLTFDARQTPLYGKNSFMPHVQLSCKDGKVDVLFSLQMFIMVFLLAYLAVMLLTALIMLIAVAQLVSPWLILIPVGLGLICCVLSLLGLYYSSKAVLGVILQAGDFKGKATIKVNLPKK